MAATHAHYIRTIHTTFTAAHPHSSSSWASAASTASSQYLNNLNLTLNSINYNPRSSSPAPAVQQNTSINTHNTHMYTHHLRDLTHSPRHNQHHSQQQGVSLPQHGQQYHSQQQQHPGSNSRLPKPITDARSTSPSPTTLSLPYPHSPVQTQVQMGGASEMPVRTRRRSASIRGAPSSMSLSLSSKRPKFDPFADEPIVPVLSLSSETASATAAPHATTDASASANANANANAKTDLTTPELDVEANPRKREVPYTIQIPAALQDDIQMYAVSLGAAASEPPATPRLAPASLPSRPLSPRAPSFTPMALKSTATGNVSAPAVASGPCTTPTLESAQPAVQTQTPACTSPTRTPSPPLSVTQTQMQMQIPTPNLSKVVASILLNRVHAVGKPMRVRRRAAVGGCGGVGYQRVGMQAPVQGNGYVKSCLSSVVSVEA